MGLSENQRTDVKLLFKFIDKNRDGKLDIKEVGVFLRALGHNPTDKELKEIIAEGDKAKDGKLNEQEFLSLLDNSTMISKSLGDEEAELKAAFKIFDRNGNGYVSADELKYVLTNVGEEKMTKADAEAMIAIADVDKDKRLNYAEFSMEMSKYWKK